MRAASMGVSVASVADTSRTSYYGFDSTKGLLINKLVDYCPAYNIAESRDICCGK